LYQEKAINAIQNIFSELSASANNMGTYSEGLAGVGWMFSHLCITELDLQRLSTQLMKHG
jgi:hypothetical protein